MADAPATKPQAQAVKHRLRQRSRRSVLGGGGAFAIAATFGQARAQTGSTPLQFYNWDTYIGDTTLADFQRATGTPVNMTLFSSNDELRARLRAGNPGFDVIVPSDEYVAAMMRDNFLQELDLSLIPNRANLLPAFQDAPFDPGRRFSMPYTWLTYGIGYRKSAMPRGFTPDSWRYLFNSSRFSQRIALPGQSSDIVRLCAKSLGLSLNDLTDANLLDIERTLTQQKRHIRYFHDDDGQDLLRSGEVDLVAEYNGDMAFAFGEASNSADGEDFGFIVPREGSLLISDCLCIPWGAPNVEAAHAFINFLLDGETGRGVLETIQYPTPNRAAAELMPAAYRDSTVLFPPADVLANCEYARYEGDARDRRYEDIFMRVAAS